jgi:hypothetical protein
MRLGTFFRRETLPFFNEPLETTDPAGFWLNVWTFAINKRPKEYPLTLPASVGRIQPRSKSPPALRGARRSSPLRSRSSCIQEFCQVDDLLNMT